MRVLVAIDGSAASDVAVELVEKAAWPEGSSIHVLEGVETAAMIAGGPVPAAVYLDPGFEMSQREAARATVDSACARLQRPGVTVQAAVVGGRAGTTIVDAAHSLEADLVVVGSRGYGVIERMLLGSVSAEVVDHAPCPVLVARGSGLSEVVLGWDGSRCAAEAAGLLKRWQIFASSRIHVVSTAAVEPPWWTGFPEVGTPELVPVYVDAANASRRQHDLLAQGMADDLRAAGLSAAAERRDGDPAGELIAAAGDIPADLIVVGTHGRTGLTRVLLGSVARNVVQHAPCSVLVVRQPAARDG